MVHTRRKDDDISGFQDVLTTRRLEENLAFEYI
jgi:hypothetical protein